MAVKKFDISEADKVAEYLGVSIHRAARRAVMSLAHRIVAKILTSIIPQEPRQPVDRGAYRAAWKAKKTPEGAEVRNTMPYSGIIEDGARAENVKVGKAMIFALRDWIIRKGLVSKVGPSPGKKASLGDKVGHAVARGQQTVEATKMAWAIAMAMKKKGIFNGGQGLKILDKATKDLEKQYLEELRNEIAREFPKSK